MLHSRIMLLELDASVFLFFKDLFPYFEGMASFSICSHSSYLVRFREFFKKFPLSTCYLINRPEKQSGEIGIQTTNSEEA